MQALFWAKAWSAEATPAVMAKTAAAAITIAFIDVSPFLTEATFVARRMLLDHPVTENSQQFSHSDYFG
jgi:hypothetical protein